MYFVITFFVKSNSEKLRQIVCGLNHLFCFEKTIES